MTRAKRAGDTSKASPYVTRGGDKLAFALQEFGLDVTELVAADLGSHQGGFVDCLLQHGAARVHSIDTCYGTLAWTLRQDERVVVHERTNALHVELDEPVDIVTVDVGWTPQRLIAPKAVSLAKPGGVVVSLLKPQYEVLRNGGRRGVLAPEVARETAERVMGELRTSGVNVDRRAESPIRGGRGNVEYLLLIRVPLA
jgi:23S rRNA (cytidine1920-2'-O)/16S rRNA (cytidine1409-2'-O)-methyltransferase